MHSENIAEDQELDDGFDSQDDRESDQSYPLDEYKLTTTPNDFNISSLVTFIESDVFKIPQFQRHYVWDLKRASKLIESLLIGLPIPQMFLYEQDKNQYLVIDGQQRLMTIYYFVKGRFPRKEKRIELRDIFDQHGKIPDSIIGDDKYFQNFNLKLGGLIEGEQNKFNGKNYDTLGEFQTSLNLATIRHMMIKPESSGKKQNGAVFEIFNRLNSGGVILNSQEIRMSLYHSDFLNALLIMNKNDKWRGLLGKDSPDIKLSDVEAILRAFAMVTYIDNYKGTINGFLNSYAHHAKDFTSVDIEKYKNMWEKFVENCNLSSSDLKIKSKKFSIMLFESIFYAACKDAIDNEFDLNLVKNIDANFVKSLKEDESFKNHTQGKTTLPDNVTGRLKQSYTLLNSTIYAE